MKTLRWFALLGIIVLAAAVTGVAHADEKVLMFTEPIEEVFPNPCTGETVTLTGEMQIMVHEVNDGGGGFHFKFTTVPHGVTATGASGTRYRSIGAHSDYFSSGPGQATAFTFSVTFLVVSEGGGDNFLAKATVHFTVDANGTLTTEFDRLRVECVG